jgi:hypothetical protein
LRFNPQRVKKAPEAVPVDSGAGAIDPEVARGVHWKENSLFGTSQWVFRGGPLESKPRSTLEIPEGAVFEMEADGLVIGFRDDVIIRGNIGHRLKKVWSENGTIELRSSSELVVEMIETKRGHVIIAGQVRAKSVKGAKITLLEGSLAARSVNAETSIDLKGGTIEADLVMCPEVLVSQTVRGRATVIECQNELGAHQLKGGFKMAEFLEMMPSAQKVIQNEASHIPQLSTSIPRSPTPSNMRVDMPPPVSQPMAAPVAPAPAPATWVGKAVEESESEPVDVPTPPPVEEPTGPGVSETGAAANDYFEEGVGAPPAADLAATTAASEAADGGAAIPVPPPDEEPALPPAVERPSFHSALADMCEQIGRVYTAQNLAVPPPVQRLTDFVEAGEYASVKGQLTTIWNQLIQYHKESKLPFAVKTTQMFQSIQRTLAANVT